MQFLKNKNIELIRGNIGKNTNRQILVHKDLDTYVIGNKKNILTAEGTLTSGAMIIYILQFADGTYKLGQLLETNEKSVAGQQGVEIWKDSYNSRKSSVSGTITLRGIFYIERSHWLDIKQDQGYELLFDDQIRSVIRKTNKKFHKNKRCPFGANWLPGHTFGQYLNKEHLIGYNHDDNKHQGWILKIILDLLRLDPDSDVLTPMVPRDYQEGDSKLITDKIEKYRKVLLAAYTSYGKTLISLSVAIPYVEKQGGGLVIATTPRVDTLENFENDAKKFSFGAKKKVIVIHYKNDMKKWRPQDIKKAIKQGFVVVLLVSVQGVRNKDKGLLMKSEINRWMKYFDICSFWIRDEKWTEYNGIETRKVIKNIEDKMPVLDLAATTSKIRDEYEPNAIVDRTLFWAMKNPLCQLPSLMIRGINWPASKILKELVEISMSEDEFTTEKLILPNPTKDGFINQSVLESLVDLFYRDNPMARRMKISIVDSDLCDLSKRLGMWVMPEGVGDWSTSIYLPLLAEILNKKYGESGELYIDSYTFERNRAKEKMSADEYAEHLLDQYSRVIILTHGKLTVGTSINKLGHIVLMDNISDGDLFEQLLGRLFRRVDVDGKNTKTNVGLWTLVPDQKLKSTLTKLVIEHCEKNKGLPQAKEYFDLLGFRAYDSFGKPVEYSGEALMGDMMLARAQTAGAGLKPTEVADYLEKTNSRTFWEGMDPEQFGFKMRGSSVSITGENNGKNAKNSKKKSNAKNKDQLSVAHIQEIINESFATVKLVSYLEKDDNE